MFRQAIDALGRGLPLMLMTVLTLGTFWLVQEHTPNTSPELDTTPTHRPDYVLKGFSAITLDEKGFAHHQFTAKRMVRYQDTQETDVEHPFFQVYAHTDTQGRQHPAYQLHSTTGTLSGDGSVLNLYGQAQLERGKVLPTGQPLRVSSAHFRAWLYTDILESPTTTRIEQGPSVLVAQNFRYDNQQLSLAFSGRVSGTLSAVPRQ
jgi:lipopolysaccharide export system protein LptC